MEGITSDTQVALRLALEKLNPPSSPALVKKLIPPSPQQPKQDNVEDHPAFASLRARVESLCGRVEKMFQDRGRDRTRGEELAAAVEKLNRRFSHIQLMKRRYMRN